MDLSIKNAIDLYMAALADLQEGQALSSRVAAMQCFNEYCKGSFGAAFLSEIDSEFLDRFLLLHLPKLLYQEQDEFLDSFYNYLQEFLSFSDMAYGTRLISQLTDISFQAKNGGYSRVLHTKKHLLEFLLSPVLSARPLVLDLNRYRANKEADKKNDSQAVYDNGHFIVCEVFRSNSVVLRKMGGCGFFIRLYLNERVIKTVRQDDVWSIKIRKDNIFGCWKLCNVNACYLKSALKYPKLSRLLTEA